jgi:malonyl-CoA decarboxylase
MPSANKEVAVLDVARQVAKPEDASGFFKQAIRTLRARWQTIAGSEYDVDAASLRPDLPGEDIDRLRKQMQACLEARGGEVSARARAAALGQAYLALDETGRKRFLRVLAEDFDLSPAAAEEALTRLRSAGDADERRQARVALRRALEPPRLRLLRQFSSLPQGVKILVNLRAELMPLTRADPVFASLDDDLKALLATWFDVDFLELRRITWESASGALLEKLIAYEAVHAIESWSDLKNRLDYDRRYFAFFHPRMPDEPLIFVEVALVEGMADNVQNLLDPTAPVHDPNSADAAIFYSISNAQAGLNGISFGNFLIKRVVDQLSHEFPKLKTFATLSPIPGFMPWLRGRLGEGDTGLLQPAERKAIAAAAGVQRGVKGWLKEALEKQDWVSEAAIAKALKAPLMRLCARYLAVEKRPRGMTLDPVAHFHLSNGARMERLNWMADRSAKGLEQSAGMMINYRYDLARIDANHESYRSTGKPVLSSAMRTLLKE